MRSAESVTVGRILVLVAVAALAGGCAAPATAPEKPSGAQFYPQPPDPPRIQYLATVATERDLLAKPGGLAAFVLGENTGELLKRPYGAAMSGGRLYVADSRGPGLGVFDFTAGRFSLLAGEGGGRLRQPINLAVDADGSKYVADGARKQVLVYDRADNFVAAYGTPEQFRPVAVAVAGDRLYVVDIEHHAVHVLDKRTGAAQFQFGKPGSADGELFHPTNIAIGPGGDVYVTDTSNFRVSRFTADGRYVRSYGQAGQTPGTFARPKGVAVDRGGRIYVVDSAFENVQVFDGSGRLLMAFGKPWDGTYGFNLPTGISIDYDNVAVFAGRADPKFQIEYLILVVSQFGPNKVDVFGFGRMAGVAYPADEVPASPSGS